MSRLGRIAHYIITIIITRAYDVARRGIRVDNKFNSAARTTDYLFTCEKIFFFHQHIFLLPHIMTAIGSCRTTENYHLVFFSCGRAYPSSTRYTYYIRYIPSSVITHNIIVILLSLLFMPSLVRLRSQPRPVLTLYYTLFGN